MPTANISYVAELANLELTPEEHERMAGDLNSILAFIDQLNELETTNVPRMAQAMAGTHGNGSAYGNARRADDPSAQPSLGHEAALQNSPVKDRNFFKVPKVIER
jgi:aspartyl-tRNA(Asn)/glutamyl-tRNA(Gln) amidotransferase subunit C